ncbi:MAG: carbohydrate ABC transporter permease [Spirochaetales bacterium]|nr:carbohydrate ABC transporter permease [Spirochaetales bacterium]
MASKSRKVAGKILFQVLMFAFGLIMIYPILWMISNSFKTTNEIFGSASLLPEKLMIDNYVRGWRYVGRLTFTQFFKNSLFYSCFSTIGVVVSSAFVAFGFARIPFKGSKFWFAVMFLTMILPYQVIMVPQFIIFQKIGWINTFKPLIVPMFMGLPFFIFLMVQFIRGIPVELDESAWIDGCGYFAIFTRIIAPLMKPAVITTTIFSFYWRWEDFLGPLLYLNKPKLYTVSLALRMFSDPQTSTDWGAIFAMGTLSLIPVLAIFIAFQKYLDQGIATTGMKG